MVAITSLSVLMTTCLPSGYAETADVALLGGGFVAQ